MASSRLCVLSRCKWLVCAIPVDSITRLVLPEEVTVTGTTPGESMIAHYGGRQWAAWDLGLLLEVGPTASSWMFLELPDAHGAIALALRSGICLRVQELRAELALPRELFRARRDAFAGGFAVSSVTDDSDEQGVLGVAIDLARLWTPAELESSRRLVSSTEMRTES
jgi:hypothetical protein